MTGTTSLIGSIGQSNAVRMQLWWWWQARHCQSSTFEANETLCSWTFASKKQLIRCAWYPGIAASYAYTENAFQLHHVVFVQIAEDKTFSLHSFQMPQIAMPAKLGFDMWRTGACSPLFACSVINVHVSVQ
jgi:hypothetical protein